MQSRGVHSRVVLIFASFWRFRSLTIGQRLRCVNICKRSSNEPREEKNLRHNLVVSTTGTEQDFGYSQTTGALRKASTRMRTFRHAGQPDFLSVLPDGRHDLESQRQGFQPILEGDDRRRALSHGVQKRL